jgi:hypothetical protein
MLNNYPGLIELTNNEKISIIGGGAAGTLADEIGYAIGYAVGWLEYQVAHAQASRLGARTEVLLHSS